MDGHGAVRPGGNGVLEGADGGHRGQARVLQGAHHGGSVHRVGGQALGRGGQSRVVIHIALAVLQGDGHILHALSGKALGGGSGLLSAGQAGQAGKGPLAAGCGRNRRRLRRGGRLFRGGSGTRLAFLTGGRSLLAGGSGAVFHAVPGAGARVDDRRADDPAQQEQQQPRRRQQAHAPHPEAGGVAKGRAVAANFPITFFHRSIPHFVPVCKAGRQRFCSGPQRPVRSTGYGR